MRLAVAVVVWVVAAAVLGPVCFFAVLMLVRPRSSMLPSAARAAWRGAGR